MAHFCHNQSTAKDAIDVTILQIYLLEVSIQSKRPRKPRNFYDKMPEGVEDNYVDELFLKGLVHKSNYSPT